MGLQPNLPKKSVALKKCTHCGQTFGAESFAPTKSLFFKDGLMPICGDCVENILQSQDYNWAAVDKLCQLADIPFVPKEWEHLRELDTTDVFYRYASIFIAQEYEGLGWQDYYKAYQDAKSAGALEKELPLLGEEKVKHLREVWGGNYDVEALEYLEQLFNGLLTTQNVNGTLQLDQARKICKMSYEIDCRIRAGDDFDKILKSYDTLVKAAEFTPKNVKNLNDFDTFGEVTKWMEKNGWRNKFYDRATRDIVDESMKNFEGFNQRLYVNESNIAEEIARRLEALKTTTELENYYETDKEYDLDAFEQDGYTQLLKETEDEDFEADIEEDKSDEFI